jgi:hypothetical protein
MVACFVIEDVFVVVESLVKNQCISGAFLNFVSFYFIPILGSIGFC